MLAKIRRRMRLWGRVEHNNDNEKREVIIIKRMREMRITMMTIFPQIHIRRTRPDNS